LETSAPAAPTFEELFDLFRLRAEALGARVGRVADAAEAAAFLRDLAGEWDASSAVASGEALERAGSALDALAAAGIPVSAADGVEAARDAALGIGAGWAGIAETGSILMAEPTLADRAVGMLSAGHAMLCPSSRLLLSLDEAAPVLRELAVRPRGGIATLVTGPSRTADIERVLTVGVQGPARVAVLFIDDME